MNQTVHDAFIGELEKIGNFRRIAFGGKSGVTLSPRMTSRAGQPRPTVKKVTEPTLEPTAPIPGKGKDRTAEVSRTYLSGGKGPRSEQALSVPRSKEFNAVRNTIHVRNAQILKVPPGSLSREEAIRRVAEKLERDRAARFVKLKSQYPQLQKASSAAFFAELEKISESAAGRKRRVRRTAQAAVVGALGYGTGYGTYKYLYPAIMKALGKTPKRLPNRAVAVASGLAGLSLAALYGYGRGWANVDPPRLNRRVLRTGRGVPSSDGSLAKRHEGSPSEVSPGVLLPTGTGELPLRAGGHESGVDNRGSGHGDNNFRRGVDKYRYGGKKARDYNFARPLRLRESGD